MNTPKPSEKKGVGRPRKFVEPARPVTVTLPERTLQLLRVIDPDRAQAIVKAVEAASGQAKAESREMVEVFELAPGQGLIKVAASSMLNEIPWLRLLRVASDQYLLIVPSGTPVEALEVAITDLLEGKTPPHPKERELLEALRGLIAKMRRASKLSKGELIVVSTGT